MGMKSAQPVMIVQYISTAIPPADSGDPLCLVYCTGCIGQFLVALVTIWVCSLQCVKPSLKCEPQAFKCALGEAFNILDVQRSKFIKILIYQ